MLLSVPQEKALALVPRIMDTLGEISGNINERRRDAVLALVERELIQGGTAQERFMGAVLKAFLQLDFPKDLRINRGNFKEYISRESFEMALRRFIQADYTATAGTTPPAYWAYDAFIEGVLRFGSQIDGWAIGEAVKHQMARDPDFFSMAQASGNWAVFFLDRHESHIVHHESDTLAILLKEFRQAEVNPYRAISIFDFGGPEHALSHDTFRQLFPRYENWKESMARTNFITLNDPGILKRDRNQTPRFSDIIATNVFAHRAWDKSNATDNQANLLCVMANALINAGRIYISNDRGDGLDYTKNEALLKLAGLKCVLPRKITMAPHETYVLERDLMVRRNIPVTTLEFTDWLERSKKIDFSIQRARGR